MRTSAVPVPPPLLKRVLQLAIPGLLAIGSDPGWAAPAKPGRMNDDQVARWVLSANAGPAFVTLSQGGKVTQVTEAAKLPAGKFEVLSLTLTSLDQITPEQLGTLGRLGHLSFLEFKDGSSLTAGVAAALAESDTLSTLIINNIVLSDLDLAPLSKIKSLRTLALRECPKLTGAVWNNWSGWGLTEFAFGGWQVAREHLPKLAGLKSLNKLTLDGSSGLGAQDFTGWSHPSVWQLWLNGWPKSAGPLRPVLGAFPRVQQVYLHGTPLDREDCASLAQLRLLQYLQIAGAGIGDAEVPVLATSRSIGNIDWYGFTGAGTSLDQLATCRPLRALGLIDGQITDAGLAKLPALTQIEHLTLQGNPALTDAGLASLVAMKQLRVLRLGKTALTNAGLLKLAELRKLETLDVTGCPNVTPDGVGNLLKLLPKCKVAFQ